MIPLGDSSRRPINFPIMTAAIIAVNAFVFVLELMGGDAFINYWSLVPADIMTPHGFITIFTSMFMHAGWEHILGNMLFFWVFGPEIEDVMGPISFLLFYLLGGIAATVAQVWIDPTSTIPNLGASGAIAAVMGAFLVTYPRDKIRTVVFLGWLARVTFLPAILMVGNLVSYTVLQRSGSACAGSGGRQRRSLHGAYRRIYLWHDSLPAVRIAPPPTFTRTGSRAAI